MFEIERLLTLQPARLAHSVLLALTWIHKAHPFPLPISHFPATKVVSPLRLRCDTTLCHVLSCVFHLFRRLDDAIAERDVGSASFQC